MMRLLLAPSVASVVIGCGSAVATEASGPPVDSGSVDVTIADTAVIEPVDAAPPPPPPPPCIPGGTQCTNCVDDDGDGLIDALDPECIGPRDNDERTFGLGIPADDACLMGCAFDGIVGKDDPCVLDARCVYGSSDPRCAYDYAIATDPTRCPTPSDACVAHCKPMVPDDCDCFGCCIVRKGSSPYLIKLVDTCTFDALDDPTKCPSCRITWRCANVKTSPCPYELPVCDPTNPCPAGYYCLTGCCIKPG